MASYISNVNLIAIILLGLLAVSLAQNEKEYGDACDVQINDCNSTITPFLECYNYGEEFGSICSCIGESKLEMKWDSVNGKCVSTLGNACDKGQPCIDYTECDEQKKCQCKDGYSSGLGIFCWASWGTNCSNEGTPQTTCNFVDGVTCDEETNVCQCYGEGLTEEWNAGTNNCTPLVGSNCDDEDTCPEKSTCLPSSYSPEYFECQCEENYSANKAGHCQRGYNATCGPNPAEPYDNCNADEQLICSSAGECVCGEDTVYVETEYTPKCHVLVGGACDVGSFGQLDRSCVFFSDCVSTDAGTRAGICTCRNGAEPSADRTTCGSVSVFVANSLYLVIGLVVLNVFQNSKL